MSEGKELFDKLKAKTTEFMAKNPDVVDSGVYCGSVDMKYEKMEHRIRQLLEEQEKYLAWKEKAEMVDNMAELFGCRWFEVYSRAALVHSS